jgi:hypothetical protein
MYRASIERARALRVWRFHIDWIHAGELDTGCLCDTQVNRFRKAQKRAGCGKPGCVMCHYEKIFNIPTIADKRAMDRAKDSYLDYEMQCNALTDLDFND